MMIHIDPLYQQRMDPSEYGKLCDAMIEFEKDVEECHGQEPLDPTGNRFWRSFVKTSFLWRIETDRDGHKIDVLSLRFSYAGRNLIFPLDSIRDVSQLIDTQHPDYILGKYEFALKFKVPVKRRMYHDNPDDILRLIDFSGESPGNLSRNPNP